MIPVKSFELTPVYVINSLPTAIVPPPVGKPVVDVNVTVDPPPVPAVSAPNDPFKVVEMTPVTVPL